MELGEVYSQSGRTYEKAVQHFSQVLELKPNMALAHGNLGKVLLSLDRIQEAIEHLQKSIELDPAFSPAYFTLAKAYRRQGQADKAEQILSRFQTLHSELSLSIPKVNNMSLRVN
jgi:tetratricopeptide (TPR) repeat protein